MQSSHSFEDAMSRDGAGERHDWIVRAAACGVFLLATLLFWRRAAGAIHEPLPASGLFLVGCLLAAAAIAHGTGRRSSARKNAALISEIALSTAFIAVAAALSVPHTSTAGLIFLWSILLLGEGWAWRTRLIRAVKGSNESAPVGEVETPAETQGRSQTSLESRLVSSARQEPRPPAIEKAGLEFAETALPEDVTQQLTRSTAADGTEELAGWLRVPFAAGQRTQSVHLAFCPPFHHTPELSVEQAEGPAARIKTAQVLPYGARLDLKLHAAEEMSSAVVLQFTAVLENREIV
jgi:hypothetical protein